MEQAFNTLSNLLLDNLQEGEHLKVSIGGERSQFVRFSKSKVRQSGIIDDASLGITLIKKNRKCVGASLPYSLYLFILYAIKIKTARR